LARGHLANAAGHVKLDLASASVDARSTVPPRE
jgi:hypothetical protein